MNTVKLPNGFNWETADDLSGFVAWVNEDSVEEIYGEEFSDDLIVSRTPDGRPYVYIAA